MNVNETHRFREERLLSIDALRGAAALGVVFYHAIQQTQNAVPADFLKWPAIAIQFISSFGYVGVFLFFVISGFCIHLRWTKAQASGTPAPVEFWPFWRRRIRRLYPPYVVAFAFYLLTAAITHGIQVTRFFLYDVWMHLLMLHNLDPKVCYSINGVFWTLAIEEQLYLAYFLLLFIRTRWGWTRTLAICFLARVGWYFLAKLVLTSTGFALPIGEAGASHWFTWALGAITVEAYFGQLRLPNWCCNLRIGAGLLVLAAIMAAGLPALHNLVLHDVCWLLLHPVWGAGFFVLVNRALLAEKNWLKKAGKPSIVSGLAWIGVLSYSLYLTHELVLLQSWRFGAWHRFPMLNMLLLAVPATIAAAWLFFRYCERPYMRKQVRARAKQSSLEEVFTPAIERAEA